MELLSTSISRLRDLATRLAYTIQTLLRPPPPQGYKRITWESHLGRPLYIDVKERVEGAAEGLQERFRSSARKTTSGSPDQDSGDGPGGRMPTIPPPAHLPPELNRPTSFENLQIGNNNDSTASSQQSTAAGSQDAPGTRHHPLLCFSTKKSEHFRQIDVTDLDNKPVPVL